MKNGELFEGDTLDRDLARRKAAAAALVVGRETVDASNFRPSAELWLAGLAFVAWF